MSTAAAPQEMQMPAGAGATMFVQDTTAREPHPVRHHDVLLDPDTGAVRTYEFPANQYVEMPADHAMRFAGNPAFIVKKEPEGPRIRPINKSDPSQTPKLQADEVIANYDELTQEALFNRCKTMPGSEHFKAGTRKKTLIDFLMGVRDKGGEQAASQGDNAADDADDLIDDDDPELADDELESLMPTPDIPGRD